MSGTDTRPRTLWTETLLEDLVTALSRNREDGEIRQILRDLDLKGLPPRYVMNKVRPNLSAASALRLSSLLGPVRGVPRKGGSPVNPMRRPSPHRWRLGLFFQRLMSRRWT